MTKTGVIVRLTLVVVAFSALYHPRAESYKEQQGVTTTTVYDPFNDRQLT